MLATPLSAGNAVRLQIRAPSGTARTRVLRKVTDDFSGESDPAAVVVYGGFDLDVSAVDFTGLVNGTRYYYRPYFLAGAVWSAGQTLSAVPAATYEDESTDALTIVRDRIESGLAVEVSRGMLEHESGRIPVLTAPPLFEDTRWPLVSVHMQSEKPSARGIGEVLDTDETDDDGKVISGEGWLASVMLVIIGWSLNPDERIELRKALRRVIVANLPVFDAAGLIEIEPEQQDSEDFQSYNAPVYQSMCTFRCMAPIMVSERSSAISDVTVTAEESDGN